MTRPEWCCESCSHFECVKWRNEDRVLRMIDCISDLVSDNCTSDDGMLHSFARSTNAEAIRVLAEVNRVQLVHDSGRMVIAKWVES